MVGLADKIDKLSDLYIQMGDCLHGLAREVRDHVADASEMVEELPVVAHPADGAGAHEPEEVSAPTPISKMYAAAGIGLDLPPIEDCPPIPEFCRRY